MGKGDKKTKRGKIVIGSYGVRRAHKKKGRTPGILQKTEPKIKDTPEQIPVLPVPEIIPVVEPVVEKVVRKTAIKKAAPKKPVEKVEKVEPKPKPKPKSTKPKKTATKPAEDLSKEKKEGTE
jgi:ribosomal small subunit protein bTHX